MKHMHMAATRYFSF